MDTNGIVSIITMVIMAAIAIGAIVWRSGQTGGRLAQKVKHLCEQIRVLFTKDKEAHVRMNTIEENQREDLQRIFDQIDAVGVEVRAISTEVTKTVRTSHGRLRRSITHQSKGLAVVLANCSHCDPDLVNELLAGPGFLMQDEDEED